MSNARILQKEISENTTFLLEHLITHIPQCVFWKDIHSIYEGCNKNYARLLGLNSPHEIIGKTDLDLGLLSCKAFVNPSKKIEEGELTFNQTIEQEEWLSLPHVERLLVSVYKAPLTNAQGEVVGMLGILRDITAQRKWAEKAQKEKEDAFHNFEYIISRMPGYIYWKNKDSEYMGCNSNLAKLSGLNKPDDMIGKTDDDFEWGKKQAVAFKKDDEEIIRTGKTLTTEYELPVQRADGHLLYVRTDKLPFYDKNGKVIGILGVAVDITDQKILEKNIIEEKNKAEIANKIKTEFVRNMEHDIRTPFSGVWGLSTILWEKETDPEKKEFLGDIANCAKELLDYCNGILDFSQIEAGTLPVLAKKFDLIKLLKSAIHIEKPAAIHRNLELHLNCDPNLPKILIGDAYRLSRLLINLISNAVKFTHTGYIKVSASQIKIQNEEKVIIRFTIEDTGIGFPEDKKDYIYEKFTRLMPSNNGKYKGLGLGLRIVKQFIEEMEGEVDVKSQSGKGTVFYCTLPFKLPLADEILED